MNVSNKIASRSLVALKQNALKPEAQVGEQLELPFDSFETTTPEKKETAKDRLAPWVKALREESPPLLKVARGEDPVAGKIAYEELQRFHFGPKSWEAELNPVDALENRDSFGRFRKDFAAGFWKETTEILSLIEKLETPKFVPAVDFVLRAEQAFRKLVRDGHTTNQQGVDECHNILKRWSAEGRFESNGRNLDNGRLSIRDGVPTLVEKPLVSPGADEALTPEILDYQLKSLEPLPNRDDLDLLEGLADASAENPELRKVMVGHLPKIVGLAGVAEEHNMLTMGFYNIHGFLIDKLAKIYPDEMETPEILHALAPHWRNKEYLNPSTSDLAARIWKKHPELVQVSLDHMAQTPPMDSIDPTKSDVFKRAVTEFGANPSHKAKGWAASQLYKLPNRGVCGYTDAQRAAPILDSLDALERRNPDSLRGIKLPFEERELSPKDYLKALAFESKTTIKKPDFEWVIHGDEYGTSFLDSMGYREDPSELFERAQVKSEKGDFSRIIATALLGNLATAQPELQPKVLALMKAAPEPQIKELAKELEFRMGLDQQLAPDELLHSMVKPGIIDPFGVEDALKTYPVDLEAHLMVKEEPSKLSFEDKWERYNFHSELTAERPEEKAEDGFKLEMSLRRRYGDDFVETHLKQVEEFYRQRDLAGLDAYLEVHKINAPEPEFTDIEISYQDDNVIIGGESLEVDL